MTCGSVEVVVTSLMTPQRAEYVQRMRRVVPDLKIQHSINGFNKSEVIRSLQTSGVPFHRLCKRHGNWGMLASTLTRHTAFARQTADFQVLLEDDLELTDRFWPFVRSMINAHFCKGPPVADQVCKQGPKLIPCFRQDPDIVQMERYAEAYLTSRKGARTLARKVQTYGIRGCGDQLYNVGEIMNESHVWSKLQGPWRTLVPTNRGDTSRTSFITRAEYAMIRHMHRKKHHGSSVSSPRVWSTHSSYMDKSHKSRAGSSRNIGLQK